MVTLANFSAGNASGKDVPAEYTNTPGYLERDIVDMSQIWGRNRRPRTSGIAMITRVWHGTTLASDAGRYLQFLLDTGVKDYLRTPGNREVRIGRKIEGEVAHFYTISTWDSIDSIRAFAGDPVDRARYYPEDKEFLLSIEPTVLQFETFGVNT